jgi:hypothetical protein
MDPLNYDAKLLQFGPLFGDEKKAAPLTNAEVADMLTTQQNDMAADDKEPNEVFRSTLAYVNTVSLGMDRQTSQQLRETIKQKQESLSKSSLRRHLSSFEITALINLTPEDYERATLLIPSLLELDSPEEKDFLDEVVNEIQKHTQYVT